MCVCVCVCVCVVVGVILLGERADVLDCGIILSSNSTRAFEPILLGKDITPLPFLLSVKEYHYFCFTRMKFSIG